MAASELASPDLEALLAQAVGSLAGDSDTARYGIAVSGGPDSMALLSLAARLFPGRVEAATVDHGLRPQSPAEAAMVADWCREQAIPHSILHPDQPVKGNVQQWARRQRYALLEGWRASRGLDWILTAHHADDQLETLLMRLNRGAGVGGLAGIRARQGHVLRPLLEARRAQLRAYAKQSKLPFIDDPSNSDPRFDRAAIRERLRDADWLDPAAANRSAMALAEVEQALDWTMSALESRYVRSGEGLLVLERTDFPRELLRRLLLRMLAYVDPDAPAPRGEALDRVIAAAAAGRKVSIGSALVVGGGMWTVKKAPARR